MPLPISGSKFDRLGARLIAADKIDPSDLELLESVLASYDDAMSDVQTRVAGLGFDATTRLKTTQTLVRESTPGTRPKDGS